MAEQLKFSAFYFLGNASDVQLSFWCHIFVNAFVVYIQRFMSLGDFTKFWQFKIMGGEHPLT